MTSLRALLHRHRRLVAALLGFTLALKLLVPTGFMPVAANGSITIQICSGTGPRTMVMALPGAAQHDERPAPHPLAEQPCAFAALAAPVLAAVDAMLLAAAIDFVAALALRPTRPIMALAPPHLRPPLRGPPALT